MNKELDYAPYKNKTKYVKIVDDSQLFSLSVIHNTTLSIDEEQQILDAEEKGLQFVKNKLIFSLQQSIDQLMFCTDSQPSQTKIKKIQDRRTRDKALQKMILTHSQHPFMEQPCKQEYTTYIYFKTLQILANKPQIEQSIKQKIKQQINKIYSEVYANTNTNTNTNSNSNSNTKTNTNANKQLNVFTFYFNIRNIIYSAFHSFCSIQCEGDDHLGLFCEIIGQQHNRIIDQGFKQLYCGLDLDCFYMMGNQQPENSKQLYMLQHQYSRNENIMKKIILFIARLEKRAKQNKNSVDQVIECKRKLHKMNKITKQKSKENNGHANKIVTIITAPIINKNNNNFRIRTSSLSNKNNQKLSSSQQKQKQKIKQMSDNVSRLQEAVIRNKNRSKNRNSMLEIRRQDRVMKQKENKKQVRKIVLKSIQGKVRAQGKVKLKL